MSIIEIELFKLNNSISIIKSVFILRRRHRFVGLVYSVGDALGNIIDSHVVWPSSVWSSPSSRMRARLILQAYFDMSSLTWGHCCNTAYILGLDASFALLENRKNLCLGESCFFHGRHLAWGCQKTLPSAGPILGEGYTWRSGSCRMQIKL